MTTIINANIRMNTSPTAATPSASTPDDFDPSTVLPAVAPLQFSGDPGAMLAALVMATAKNERTASRDLRDQAMRAQETAETAEIQDMRDKADMQRIQGVVDGICDFVQAGMDVAQGVANLDATLDKAHANALDRDIKAADHDGGVSQEMRNANVNAEQMLSDKGARAEAWSNGWKAGSEFVGGAKQIADGAFQGALTDKDADEKAHEAAASSFKAMADDLRDDEKDAKDLLSKALDFYKEYVDTKNQTAMAAIHRA